MAPKNPQYQTKKTLLEAVKEINEIYDLVLKLGNKSTETICLSLQEVLNDESISHVKLVEQLSQSAMETLIAFNIIDGFIDEDLYSDELVEAIEARDDETVCCDEPIRFRADDPDSDEEPKKKKKKKKKKDKKEVIEEDDEDESEEEDESDEDEDSDDESEEEEEEPEWKKLQAELDENRDSMKKKKIKKMEKKIEELKAAHRDALMDKHVDRLEGKKEKGEKKKRARTKRGAGAIDMIAKVLIDNPKDWMSKEEIHKKAQELLGSEFSIKTVAAQLGSGKTPSRLETEKGLCKVKVRGDKPAEREFKYDGPVD